MASLAYKNAPSSTAAMPMSMDVCTSLGAQSSEPGAFDLSDFLTDSTTPESGTECVVYPVNNDSCYSLEAWTAAQLKTAPGRVRVLSDDTMSSANGDGTPKGPKKAKRQAQNRAAQRAFRERKERYIQELEGKAVEMRREISELEKGHLRLESLLKVARAEIDTLRSMSQKTCTHARRELDHGGLAYRLDEVEGRHSIVLTLDFGVRNVPVTQQKSPVDGDNDD